MSDPTPQDQAIARDYTREYVGLCDCGHGACSICEARRAFATALADARIDASVPIHLSRPEHPRAKWCDGAFILKATTERDKYTCVPCAIAVQRERDAQIAEGLEPFENASQALCDLVEDIAASIRGADA